MNFNIRMGIPEMQELWLDLQEKYRSGNIKKKEEQLYKKWGKALKLLSADPGYPSLQTHEIEPLSRRYGMKVWQSYLENKTSGAMRMYWVYGPDQKDITIIGLEPHPEDMTTFLACSTRSISRQISSYHKANFKPRVIGSAWIP